VAKSDILLLHLFVIPSLELGLGQLLWQLMLPCCTANLVPYYLYLLDASDDKLQTNK